MRGLLAELKVIEYYKNQNFKIIAWRKKFFEIETDLIFEDTKHNIFIVEAKSISSWEWGSQLLSASQKNRLLKVKFQLQQQNKNKIFYLNLCIYDFKNKKIEILNLG